MVDAVGRNTSGRWEDRLWTGRERGRGEGKGDRERGRGEGREEKERGRGEGEREGGENLVTFVAGCAS